MGGYVGHQPGGYVPRGRGLADRELPRRRDPHDRPGVVRVEQGASRRTAVEVPGWSKALMALAVATVLVVAWRWAARVGLRRAGPRRRRLRADRRRRGHCSCSRRILSPQYVLWFVPFAAIATAAGIARSAP